MTTVHDHCFVYLSVCMYVCVSLDYCSFYFISVHCFQDTNVNHCTLKCLWVEHFGLVILLLNCHYLKGNRNPMKVDASLKQPTNAMSPPPNQAPSISELVGKSSLSAFRVVCKSQNEAIIKGLVDDWWSAATLWKRISGITSDHYSPIKLFQ